MVALATTLLSLLSLHTAQLLQLPLPSALLRATGLLLPLVVFNPVPACQAMLPIQPPRCSTRMVALATTHRLPLPSPRMLLLPLLL